MKVAAWIQREGVQTGLPSLLCVLYTAFHSLHVATIVFVGSICSKLLIGHIKWLNWPCNTTLNSRDLLCTPTVQIDQDYDQPLYRRSNRKK